MAPAEAACHGVNGSDKFRSVATGSGFGGIDPVQLGGGAKQVPDLVEYPVSNRELVSGQHATIDHHLRQFSDADVAELNRSPFGFEAHETGRWAAILAAGNFVTVDPQADFAVNRADVIRVPLAEPF